jgi:diguanylate cyclase (GGDEF)-like protein
MKRKRWLIYLILSLIVLIIIGVFTFKTLNNENKLTSEERTWINNNINNVQNIYITKDENIFSKDGKGVFYAFLDDFTAEYGLNINIINTEENINNDIALTIKRDINDNDKVFYKDHYVLVSKNKENINDNRDLNGKTIGVLKSDLDYLNKYIKESVTFISYDNIDDLLKALDSTIHYFIVPRMKYIDVILTNNFEINYHLNDINNYYVLNTDDEVFSIVLKKFFAKWQDKINKYIKTAEFDLFTNSLKINDTEIDKMLSVDYGYGFINNSPYEVIMSGKYGGIIAEYLKEFSDFSGVYFDITKYKNSNSLARVIERGRVDLYFDFNEKFNTNFLSTTHGIKSKMAIVTTNNNDIIIDSVYGLIGREVYVEANSNIYKYLNKIGNITLLTYNNNQELFKLNKKDVIIAMDSYIFDYYQNSKLSNYTNKYDTYIDSEYTFKVKNNYNVLYKLLDKYINYLDESMMINKGINSHTITMEKGNILNNVARYFILTIASVLIIGLIVYKKSKRIKIAKRIRKEDKIRFIDELTCLKNRVYLSDSIKTWNNNTVYPQTVIVVDLNRLQEINDKYGVSEGDRQIKGLANALIKTQLDNSDIMRSDGNEFVIYAVGYNQKQIVNYMHKLNKEIRKLPYDFGAEFGFSTIENNLKTVEDALNEATIDMKNKKEDKSEKENR